MSFFSNLGQTQQQQQQPFSFSAQPTSSLFQLQQSQQSPMLGAFSQQQQQQQQQGGGLPPVLLVQKAVDPQKGPQPAAYSTRWDDLLPESQHILLLIEERVLEYRDQSGQLERNSRLHNPGAVKEGFEEDASSIGQDLSGLSASIAAEQASLQDLLALTQNLLKWTETAVRSFLMLRNRYPRLISSAPSLPNTTSPAGSTSAQSLAQGSQPQAQPSAADLYVGLPVLPSPFLEQSVARFEQTLAEHQQKVEELEKLLHPPRNLGRASIGNSYFGAGNAAEVPLAVALPAIMTNVHDFFIHVAAQVEALHQQVECARAAFLAYRRKQGLDGDPFLEAERRELAKKEVAGNGSAGLQAAPPGAPQTNAHQGTPGSLFGSSTIATPAPNSSSLFGSSNTFSLNPPAASWGGAAATSSIFGGNATPSLFGSSSTPATLSSSSIFAATTPASSSTPSIFGASPAGAITAPAGGSLFGAPETPSLAFGTPQTGTSLFGAGTSSPFAATTGGMFAAPATAPAAGGLFGTPGASGGSLFGFGASTAAASKPKPRTGRRSK